VKVRSFLKKLRPVAIGTSMADLALLLLVFFMVSTSTEPPWGTSVQLPDAVTTGAEQEGIYLTIADDGSLFYDGKATTLQDLRDYLAMRQAEKGKTVSITADKNLPYSVVNGVLAVLREQDFLNVVFMAESAENRR
jgi:biopolymer transport protein ExbD